MREKTTACRSEEEPRVPEEQSQKSTCVSAVFAACLGPFLPRLQAVTLQLQQSHKRWRGEPGAAFRAGLGRGEKLTFTFYLWTSIVSGRQI